MIETCFKCYKCNMLKNSNQFQFFSSGSKVNQLKNNLSLFSSEISASFEYKILAKRLMFVVK